MIKPTSCTDKAAKRKPGRPVGSTTGPRPGSRTMELRVRVTPDEMARLEAAAEERGTTKSALVRAALVLALA